MVAMATSPAERMREFRKRRRESHFREVRMTLPDARLQQVRERIADTVARLDPVAEDEALRWIEAVTDLDESPAR